MAENPPQEECERDLRDAEPRRHRRLAHRAGDYRKLPDTHFPAERTRCRAADRAYLLALRAQPSPDRDIDPGYPEARLLLPGAAGQPADIGRASCREVVFQDV